VPTVVRQTVDLLLAAQGEIRQMAVLETQQRMAVQAEEEGMMDSQEVTVEIQAGAAAAQRETAVSEPQVNAPSLTLSP
jgi:hypothetical protein